jgi:hypothetical protein
VEEEQLQPAASSAVRARRALVLLAPHRTFSIASRKTVLTEAVGAHRIQDAGYPVPAVRSPAACLYASTPAAACGGLAHVTGPAHRPLSV